MLPSPEDGAVWSLDVIRDQQRRSGELYVEFFRIPAMSLGLYALPAGGVDPQTPHREDEIYYVVQGRATITIAGQDRAVEPGSTIFVAQGVDHRFHTITEALELLVIFAPAESPRPLG
jgi:mannose-6-phosphate isomerase-like protein (cupin superfamily)